MTSSVAGADRGDATPRTKLNAGAMDRAPVSSTARLSRRRRRPTGAPPPLPRSIGSTGRVWVAALALLGIWLVVLVRTASARRFSERIDAVVLRAFAHLRMAWLTPIAQEVDRIASGWLVSVLALALVTALLVFKRWRHLFTYVGSLIVLELIGGNLYDSFARPRSYGVTIIGDWAGFSMPSTPVALMTSLLVGATYSLVAAGHPRQIAKVGVGVTLAIFVVARLYLGVDHPSDILVGVVLAVAVTLVAFRVFTPNAVWPVTYRRGKTAHLDVEGPRGDAIRKAVLDQLGLTVIDVRPVGLEGSGGSTPLRLKVAGQPDTYLFGKLYALSHVRADRWYKLGRTILYGRLEDEAPFQSVRRFVEYEDYTLRLVRDAGIPTAAAFGIVEITPEREYLLVTEFFDGAREMGEADIDDGVIDEALLIVRRLWDAGLAHRDIKPANLLVRDCPLERDGP
ncbi:MAG: hypothetical protein QOJ19_914, partial [Acidimicrobiia bacterium]|nr:hypothetical protein [Acidimicrobiia bacterium]